MNSLSYCHSDVTRSLILIYLNLAIADLIVRRTDKTKMSVNYWQTSRIECK